MINFIKPKIYLLFTLFHLFYCNYIHSQNSDDIAVSMGELNVLYIGINNTLTIAIPGVPAQNIKIKIDNGTIEGANGKFIVQIYKQGIVTLEIFNKEKFLGIKELRALFIPSPVPYLGNLTGDTNSKSEDLINVGCITAQIPNFLLNLKFKVTSFSMSIGLIEPDNSVSNIIMLNSNNGCLTEEMKAYILNPNIESSIHFDDIYVQCPDGIIRRINNRITIRLTDEILTKLDLEKKKVVDQSKEILHKEQWISDQKTKMKIQSSILEKQNTLILKRKKEINAQESEIMLQKNILSEQVIKIKNQSRLLGISILVILLIAFLMIISVRSKGKLREANLKLADNNIIIARKNQEIIDSINYAERIQRSILPPLNKVKQVLQNSFILFKPKDIVSGDFYWFFESEDKILIAAADCTGHGVPGAFMSAIASEKLNEAAMRSNDVSDILKLVNIGIKKVMHQSGNEYSTSDGMDIAICAFDKKMTKVEYAGANRPIWIVKDGNSIIDEKKATKASIGGHTTNEQKFEKHELSLEKNDTVYLFSDGFADQFGGINNKKLKTKKLKEEILANINKSMAEQHKYFDSFIENWKGNMEQTDDILVIGIRI